MRVALAGPIETAAFVDYLPDGALTGLPPGLGGSPVNLLALELLKRGYEVILLSLDQGVEEEVAIQGRGLTILFGPFRRKRARDMFAVERLWLVDKLREQMPDIVHAHWTYEYAMAATASGLPHLVTAHDAPWHILRIGFTPYRIVRTWMALRVLRDVRNLSSVSPYVAKHLRRYMGYRRPIEIIPNGLPDTSFSGADRIAGRERLTFATILTGWSGRKNGEYAIEAFAEYRRDRPDARMLMFGNGHGPDEQAPAWARERGIDEGIEFVGQIGYDALLQRLSAEVDVLIHPSREESFGMTLIEAMAMGIPVIAGERAGAVPWTIGGCGLLVDIMDAQAVARAMKDLDDDRGRLADLGQRGRRMVATRFHMTTVADAYTDAYAKILARGERNESVARTR